MREATAWLSEAASSARRLLERRTGLLMLVYAAAAAATGAACVLFMWGFEAVLAARLDFARAGAWAWVTTPLLFVAAVELVRRAAPCAAGTGIPQAAFAARHLEPRTESRLAPLISWRTLAVKIAALFLGLLAGASTGREGPSVHVAACVFVGIVLLLRRLTGLKADLRSAVIAGGAAGLAAAFNTPLAGVTFAIEELSSDYFGVIKEYVILAIVIAAVAAKSLTGEYSYFGRLLEPPPVRFPLVLAIGVGAGLLGAAFSAALLRGQEAVAGLRARWGVATTAALALLLLAVARSSSADVMGPGNEAARALVRGEFGAWAWSFPFQKIAATLATYWSGLAGGIFAPSLSVGAALGADAARLAGAPVSSCALVGMAAFLSGTIQAPITTFVIIFEMTGHHDLLLPVMTASLAGSMAARLAGARHLYKALAESYASLLA